MGVKNGGGHGSEPIHVKTPLPSLKKVWGESPPHREVAQLTACACHRTRPNSVNDVLGFKICGLLV